MTPARALLGIAGITTAGVAYAVSIAPAAHDFGNVAVGNSMAKQFTISVVGGGSDSLTMALTGAGAGDFRLTRGNCAPVSQMCDATVAFQPRSKGPKSASLDVVDRKGQMVSATLRGIGVNPKCTNDVVFCNYAFLYSGTFGWTTATETVDAGVDSTGAVTCHGSATARGRPPGTVSGTDLIGVEFVRGSVTDSAGNEGPIRLVYRVTVACPSPAFPATAEFPALPSQPAELGHFFRETYKQPADSVGMNLKGTSSYPVEGEGTVTVTWNLKRKP